MPLTCSPRLVLLDLDHSHQAGPQGRHFLLAHVSPHRPVGFMAMYMELTYQQKYYVQTLVPRPFCFVPLVNKKQCCENVYNTSTSQLLLSSVLKRDFINTFRLTRHSLIQVDSLKCGKISNFETL